MTSAIVLADLAMMLAQGGVEVVDCIGVLGPDNLDKLPAKGAILIAAPLKIKAGTAPPVRALALVPRG
jgi:kynurenine formamidase